MGNRQGVAVGREDAGVGVGGVGVGGRGERGATRQRSASVPSSPAASSPAPARPASASAGVRRAAAAGGGDDDDDDYGGGGGGAGARRGANEADADIDVLEWQQRVCNDGYYDASEASEVLDFLDIDALSELGRSMGDGDGFGAGEDEAPVRWKRGQSLGCGAHGEVFLGLNETDGTLLAAKQIPLAGYAAGVGGGFGGEGEEVIEGMEREIRLMSRLTHRNIVRYISSQRDEYVLEAAGSNGATSPSAASDGGRRSDGGGGSRQSVEYLTIFMEYVPGGSLTSLLRRFGSLNITLVRLYTRQILAGLAYLHAHAVVHRDIKGANVLVERSGVCKLADFGASKSFAEQLESSSAARFGPRSLRGTPAFMAPEVIKQTGYGRKSDIWSVGCTVIEMATGRPPWSNYATPIAAMFAVAASNDMPEMPPNFPADGVDFLRLCFQRNPADRPTAAKLLRHPFIAGSATDEAAAAAVAAAAAAAAAAVANGEPRPLSPASAHSGAGALTDDPEPPRTSRAAARRTLRIDPSAAPRSGGTGPPSSGPTTGGRAASVATSPGSTAATTAPTEAKSK